MYSTLCFAVLIIQFLALLGSFLLSPQDVIFIISKLQKISADQLIRIETFIDGSFFYRLRVIAIFNVIGALLFVLKKERVFEAVSIINTSLKSFFGGVSKKALVPSFLFLSLKIMLSAFTPLTTDELFNFNNYVERGPLVALTFGIGPNNHVLHTFATSLFYWVSGLPKFSIRFIELLSLFYFVYFFLKKYTGRLGWLTSILLLIILNLSIDFFWQSSISRGYSMLFVFSFCYLHYGFDWLQHNKIRSLLLSSLFGVLAICVLPSFLLLLVGFYPLVLIRYREQHTLFLKHVLGVVFVSFLFYEPILLFSGKHFMLGNGWIQASSNFIDQFTYMTTELLSLSGFGSWALGLSILALQLIYSKKEPIALYGLLLWLVILVSSLLFQYTPPVRVYIYILAVSFFFLSEIANRISVKPMIFASVLMLVNFFHNLRTQVVPVYQRYHEMEKIFATDFNGKIFTNSDLYYNKALYLSLTENYPEVTYASDRISNLKYLILTHENRFLESDLKEYERISSNQEVHLYKRK